MPGSLGLDCLPSSVPGAVVDKENLVPDSLFLQQRTDGICRQGNGVLLIVGWEHYRQQSVPQRVLCIHGFISCFIGDLVVALGGILLLDLHHNPAIQLLDTAVGGIEGHFWNSLDWETSSITSSSGSSTGILSQSWR